MKKRGRKRITISDKHLSLLGQMPDWSLASIAGVSPGTIARIRKERDIPLYRKLKGKTAEGRATYFRRRLHQSHPGMFEMLGNKSDAFIGDAYGLSRERIRQYRSAMGIDKCKKGFLGSLSDIDMKYFLNNAGVVSDAELANAFSVSVGSICRAREQYGIQSKKENDTEANTSKLENIISRLGVDSDRLIAREVGVSSSHVARYRNRLGIKAIRTGRWG